MYPISRNSVLESLKTEISLKFNNRERNNIAVEFYRLILESIVEALNTEDCFTLSDRVYDLIGDRNNGNLILNHFGNIIDELLIDIKNTFKQFNFPKDCKYKLVKSELNGTGAIDKIVLDDILFFNNKNTNSFDLCEVISDSPDIEMLNLLEEKLYEEVRRYNK